MPKHFYTYMPVTNFRTKALSYLSSTREGLHTLASELGTMLERKTDRTTLSVDRDQGT